MLGNPLIKSLVVAVFTLQLDSPDASLTKIRFIYDFLASVSSKCPEVSFDCHGSPAYLRTLHPLVPYEA